MGHKNVRVNHEFRSDIPQKFNEVNFIDRNKDRLDAAYAGLNIPPYEIIIHPSSTCNLVCDWCIGDHIPTTQIQDNGEVKILTASKEAEQRLSNNLANPQNLEHAIRNILEFKTEVNGVEFRVERFAFSGLIGEPLVARTGITKVAKLIKDSGRTFGVFSNAVLLDEKTQLALKNAEYFNFSLDAGQAETYARLKFRNSPLGLLKFHSAIKNVRTLREVAPDLEINVSFVLYPENHKELYQACQIAKDIGAKHFRIKQDISGGKQLTVEQRQRAHHEFERCRDHFESDEFTIVPIHRTDRKYKAIRTFSKCTITEIFGAVDSEGSVVPCNYHPRPGGHTYGNLLEMKFEHIWESRKRAQTKSKLPSICPKVCDPFKMRANTLLQNMY